MAVTRSMLAGMGLTAEQVSAIIEAHSETVEGLKKERDSYKAEAESYKDVKKELDALKKSVNDGEDWESKYNDLSNEYEKYKNDIAEKTTLASKEKAYRELLKETGIADKYIDSVMNVTKLSEVSLNKDGKLKDIDKLTDSIKDKYSGFIQTVKTEGAKTVVPPSNSGGGRMTYAQINEIKDANARQKAIAENLDSYIKGE